MSHSNWKVATTYDSKSIPVSVQCCPVQKAIKDYRLMKVTPARQKITAYGGAATIPICGTTLLRVWRGDYRCKLDCKLVDRDDIRPILGRKACVGMKIVAYLDNDDLNKPHPGNAVYAVDNKYNPMSDQEVPCCIWCWCWSGTCGRRVPHSNRPMG